MVSHSDRANQFNYAWCWVLWETGELDKMELTTGRRGQWLQLWTKGAWKERIDEIYDKYDSDDEEAENYIRDVLASVDEVVEQLADQDYLADRGLGTAIYLALRLVRPLLLEGQAGVGKTEVSKALGAWSGGEFIRLQCYEGIDASQAVYEWDYARQLLHLRAAEAIGTTDGTSTTDLEDELYDERFLVRRPLLQALSTTDGPPPVLLIDEGDRADDEFEAFLLEILSDYAVTVPELGTFAAEVPPVVVITSTRTRDVHDALKRRCLYHWVEHPDVGREVEILRVRAPHVSVS